MHEPWRRQPCSLVASITAHEVIKRRQGGRSDVITASLDSFLTKTKNFGQVILISKNQSNDVIIKRQHCVTEKQLPNVKHLNHHWLLSYHWHLISTKTFGFPLLGGSPTHLFFIPNTTVLVQTLIILCLNDCTSYLPNLPLCLHSDPLFMLVKSILLK